MAHRHRFLVALITLPALLCVGCGGSASNSKETTARAQLIAQADPICKQTNVKRLTINKTIGEVRTLAGARTLRTIARAMPGLAANEHQAVARLRTLTAPPSLSKDWQEILAGMQQLANNTGKLGVYARSKNVKGLEKVLASSQQLRLQLINVGTRDGFAHCGRLT